MDYSCEVDDHIHCRFCFYTRCDYEKCPVRPCPECHVPLHGCKVEDHLLICLKVRAPCLNCYYGCTKYVRRDRMSAHLVKCPASVIFCALQWNRRVLSKHAKRRMKRVAKRLDPRDKTVSIDPSEVDVCSAVADQKLVLESYRCKRTERKYLTDFQNPLHPLLPLRLPLDEQTVFDDTDSSDEENRKKEEQLRKKKSPFENCYLCKIDPTSQHLHKLGNLVDFKDDIKVEKKPVKPKFSPIPAFFEARSLYLHIIKEHLSPFAAKADDVLLSHRGIAVYTFFCNQTFRRCEYDEHYELVHADSEELIERCPMYADGCSFFYHKRIPWWGTLKYSDYLMCVVHSPPSCYSCMDTSAMQSAQQGFMLNQLPLLVLDFVVGYLDSCALRCLSATNKCMRFICFTRYSSSAMVHLKWGRTERGWDVDSYVLEFSKCNSRILDWKMASRGALFDHLQTCGFKPKAYEANVPKRILLPFFRK